MTTAQKEKVAESVWLMLTTVLERDELELTSKPISIELAWHDVVNVELSAVRKGTPDDVHVQAQIDASGAVQWWQRDYPNQSWTMLEGAERPDA